MIREVFLEEVVFEMAFESQEALIAEETESTKAGLRTEMSLVG